MPGNSPNGIRPLPVGLVTPDFFRFAVADAFDAVVVTSAGLESPGPTILYVNAAFERMSGYAAEDVVGKSPRVLQGPLTDRGVLRRLREDLEAGREFHGRTVNYRKDGSEYRIEWRVAALRDEDRVVGYVAIQRDVTREALHASEIEEAHRLLSEANDLLEARVAQGTAELRHSVEELASSNEDLRESNGALAANNRDMATFTYTVSHDLRQPARAIVANAQWLEEDFGPSLPSEARDLLVRQSNAARRMSALIDDLLRMAQLGRTAVVRERLDLAELLAHVWEELHAEQKGARLQVQEGMTAHASRSLLGVVYQNLLGNALKFRAPERPLGVEAGRREDGALFVRDNGSGFDQIHAERIFAPFERLRRSDVEGSGFGLHNAQRIVEQHGGRMWAEGRAGEGATFYFTLE